uniref:Uncharacterized protein n=1 Tax=Caudovirales sp. ctkvU4 TaxID=2826783 RepID=A0A8S5QRJ7_9CAUD|nr:MAG TPA: hypothetical protein [Caudovirales sp. ctkvU4]
MWLYRSPIGKIYIVQLPDGRYGMRYNDIIWESCHSPEAEADDVYMQVTGCDEWDSLDTTNIDVPMDLSMWERI